MPQKMLIINPGSTSTKVALFDGRTQLSGMVIRHNPDKLRQFDNVADQFEPRMRNIDAWLENLNLEPGEIQAVVGRGAPLRPMEGGSYAITEQMLDDVKNRRYSNHASNLGAIIAHHLAERYGAPALISDPITADNFTDLARLSGLPEIPRKSRAHTLNIKEVSRREAARMGKTLETASFVTCHMGGGISVAALRNGQIIDVNDGLLGMGPFSPDRCGAIPIGGLVDLCYSGEYTREEMIAKLSKKSGLVAYTGQSDLREVEKMIDDGDENALRAFDAMAYQIAKEIGIAAVALAGEFDAVIITGGMANSDRLVAAIAKYAGFLGEFRVVRGEFEMEALAAAGVRFLSGEETLKHY